jgi:mono/diheme cytochrome c family protein
MSGEGNNRVIFTLLHPADTLAPILTQRKLMRTLRVFVVLIAIVAVSIFSYRSDSAAADSKSDKWLSPAASAAKKNPITSTPESIGAGQKIYSKTCVMCHGKTGDADGPAVIELNIHPAKLSNPQLATESDGSLFWKITTGKKPMPAYGKRLSETDRWNLVNYVRTLSKH